jgi:hypothetical protein
MKFKDRIAVYVSIDLETNECSIEWDDYEPHVIVQLLKEAANELERKAGTAPAGTS